MSINFTSLNQIESLNKLAEGGEATIYEYDSKRVIKIFKSNVNLERKEKKVKYFISIQSQLPKNVIGPEEEVTVKGKFVGYAMKKLVDAKFLHMVINSKFLTANNLSNRDVLQIIVDFGKDLGKLHSAGIIVGDISDYNFQIKGKDNYFIDVDSWGIEGKFESDAYTELFTCPDSYLPNGSIEFSIENENYNFAILTFFMLTKIHPFGGTYFPNEDLSILERMKMKISIVGKYKADIKIPKIINSWKWMSPQLEKDFIEIFEHGNKMDITADLQELLQNMKYCNTHDIFYYSKYSDCPLCNEKANIKVAPIVTKVTQTENGPKITVVFAAVDCAYILSDVHYLNKSNEAVHFASGRKFTVERDKIVNFSGDGKIVFVSDDDFIQLYDENNQVISNIKRMHKSNYLIKDRILYYVDRGNNLVKLLIAENGNMPKYLNHVYNPVFEVSDDGKVFVVSRYPKTAIITTPDYTFELDYDGRINEYAIKYDCATQKWLFVYQFSNGKYRTIVFNKNRIEYDDVVIMYNVQTLENIEFYNNTIYNPADGKIVGINIVKNVAKEFACNVVDESSKLKFTNNGFIIYNKDKIYNYG